MKIKVLHIITSLDADGAQHMLLKLCQNISAEKFDFKVINLRQATTFGAKFEELGVRVENIGMRRMFPSFSALRRIAAIIREYNPDLIQGWMYHGNLAATAGRCLAGYHGPLLWNIRKATEVGEFRPMTRLTIKLGAWMSSSIAKIIYCGRFIAESHYQLGYSTKNAVIIPNGFDTDRFAPSDDSRKLVREKLRMPQNAIIVGMTARYHPHKDHPNFIRAAALVRKEFPDTYFILAGRGLDKSNAVVRGLVEELGLNDQLFLLGEHCSVETLIPAFDVYCLSSSAEGFPNSLGEAMSCAVPCVSTDAGASAEVLGSSGVVVPVRDSEKLASAVTRLLRQSPEDRSAIGKGARTRVIEQFSLSSVAERYAEVYRTALVNTGSAAEPGAVVLSQRVSQG
jgi:glycosyltransferase involved in cell wall biosynthesis